ncbi:MAG: carboxypeptidase-like regulatory domain-containing protein [Planctomycetota bacterium]|nr:carboxypeptidase-like regulatory domain-containing protein [Planctomycetota bacterium]
MSRRLLTGLLLLVLAAVVGSAWWATGGGTKQLPGPGIAGPSAPGKSGAPISRGGTRLTADDPNQETARQAGRELAEAGPSEGVASIRRPRWGRPRDAVWVTGRVDLPKGTPPGEVVIVEAEGSAFPNDPEGGRWHRVRIDDEGNFRVAFAPKTRYGRINLAARYVYLEERIKVELFDPENHNDIVITPKLGGLVIATVLAPRHAAFDADPLEGVTVAGAKGSGFGGDERDGWWTGREGEYEVGGLAPGEGYSIEARSPLWANGRTKDVEVREGQITNVSVKLSLGAQLSGKVVDELGNVVTGGEVIAVPRGQGGGGMPFRGATALATSDAADGTFELRGIPEAEIELVASANGYLDGKLEVGEVGDGTERNSLTIKVDSGGKLSGIVKWPSGAPAEDAIVRVVQSSTMAGRFGMDRVRGEVKVGADGAFYFSGLEPDQPCNIAATAIHPDQRPKPGSKVSLLLSKKTPLWIATLEKVDPGAPPLELELGPGDVLSGKCVDDAGEPLLHFAVLASPAGSSMLSSSSRKPVRGRFRDEGGEFHLKGVQAGEWEVKVSAPGHTDSERRRIDVPYDGELIFNLSRTASITGSVYGPRGELSPGARVWAEHGGGKSTNATADKDGLFDLGRLYPGEVTLYADSDDAARSLPMIMRLGPGEEREDVTLRVQPGARIVAQVHPEAGTREGRRITLRQQSAGDFPFGGGMGGGRNNSSTTDADGAAVFEGLDAGTYVLEMQPERNPAWENDPASRLLRGANQKKAEVEVTAGTTSTVTLGGPSPERVIVTGRITVNGEPVAAGLVTAMDLETNQERPSSAANADEEGNYRLELDHPGRWRFSVRFGQGSWTTVTQQVSSGEHRIDFEIPEAKVTGILRGHDGQPLAETAVGMVDSESDGRRNDWFAQKNAVTDAEGRYKFENLAPGTYYIRAGGGDGGFGFLREQKQEHGRVLVVIEVKEDSGEIEQDIKLPLAGEISGNVRNADGQPVGGARISVQDSEGRNLSQFDFFRSGPDGAYTYGGVGPGRYTVTASQGDKGSGSETVKVYEGATTELDLILK